MEELHFYEGELPLGYQPGFERSLYNQPTHLLLQSPAGWHSFYVLNTKRQRIEGTVFFYVTNHEAFSPWRAPFGSVEFSDNISSESVFRFLEFVESRLVVLGVRNVIIKNSPQYYAPVHAALLETFLFNLGYRVVGAEVGAMVPVNYEQLPVDSWEKRKLRQSREANLEFRELTLDHLDDIYLFILTCRKQKNYTLSMTLAELRKTVTLFPDRYLLFGVFQNDRLISATVAVRVTSEALYNFYCDHDKHFDQLSPVVFLIEGIYHYCGQQKIKLLDLGTSAVEGKPNFGLLEFKMRLRGQPTAKLTFQKDISL